MGIQVVKVTAPATPETVTEVDPLLIVQMQPPCEALTWRHGFAVTWGYGRHHGATPCPEAAEFVMTIAAGCTCVYTGFAHLLGCRQHAITPGVTVFCQCCQAPSQIVALDAL